ncbi:hypothetical protein NM688_g7594 [Phlebia brevispora]|uniref:Uncharacterized protein n=1 Tax=Phlebia brevispora TaxID=194682 RepID=A0ACC1S3E8_9APHY|nr:hypothetical protein NM688_g7594 [Phlebia brevispora]
MRLTTLLSLLGTFIVSTTAQDWSVMGQEMLVTTSAQLRCYSRTTPYSMRGSTNLKDLRFVVITVNRTRLPDKMQEKLRIVTSSTWLRLSSETLEVESRRVFLVDLTAPSSSWLEFTSLTATFLFSSNLAASADGGSRMRLPNFSISAFADSEAAWLGNPIASTVIRDAADLLGECGFLLLRIARHVLRNIALCGVLYRNPKPIGRFGTYA